MIFLNENNKILYLLNNQDVSGYAIEMMSRGRISTMTVSRYRNRLKLGEDKMNILDGMSLRTKKILLVLAEEMICVRPGSKKEVREYVKKWISENKNLDVKCS